MKKFILHCFKYGLVVFLVLNCVALLNLYFLRNASFYKTGFLNHEVKQTSFDYVIIGSSIGLTTLNTQLIDSITSKKGINLSIDDTSISSNYLMLQHFYSLNKKTKYCILAINSWDLLLKNPSLNNNDYRFLPFVTKPFVHEYYKSMEKGFFKPLTLSKYIPAIGVSYYNTEIFYPSLVAAIKPNKKNRFDSNGNYTYPKNIFTSNKKYTTQILQFKNPFVEKIARLCKVNDTKLIVYQAPVYKTKFNFESNQYNIINHSNLIVNTKYFYNDIHLNSLGRTLASQEFSSEFLRILNQ